MEKEFVLTKLREKESEYDIDIIYAYLGGSRQFNTHTDKSDYDIYFVYKGEPSKYGINWSDCDGNCNYSIVGIKHSLIIFDITSGERKYALDSFRASVVYIPNDEFVTECYNLALTVDYNKFSLTFKKAADYVYTNFSITTKKRKQILMFAMRHLWTEANRSCMHPVDTRVLVEYFIGANWYDSAKSVLDNCDSDLTLLLESIIEGI